jgi:hypothetical protein
MTGAEVLWGAHGASAQGPAPVTDSRLFSYAKAPKNLPQQIVRGEFPGDRGKGDLRESELFGEEFQLPALCARGAEVGLRVA